MPARRVRIGPGPHQQFGQGRPHLAGDPQQQYRPLQCPDGRLDLREFETLVGDLRAASKRRSKVPHGVRDAFKAFDRNHSGFLNVRELRSALAHLGVEGLSERGAQAVLRRYDARPDGKLDLDEFHDLTKDLLKARHTVDRLQLGLGILQRRLPPLQLPGKPLQTAKRREGAGEVVQDRPPAGERALDVLELGLQQLGHVGAQRGHLRRRLCVRLALGGALGDDRGPALQHGEDPARLPHGLDDRPQRLKQGARVRHRVERPLEPALGQRRLVGGDLKPRDPGPDALDPLGVRRVDPSLAKAIETQQQLALER